MPALGVKLDPGFTVAQYRSALLSMCSQLWGNYTLINTTPGSSLWLESAYIEWPDIAGRKHVWNNTSSSNMIPRIATHREFSGSAWVYKNTQGNQGWSSAPSTSVATYLIAAAGDNYRALSFVQADVQRVYVVGEFEGAALWWGEYERVFHTLDRLQFNTLPGLNPTGAIDSSGNANPAGMTTFVANQRSGTIPENSILAAREVRINYPFQHDSYGTLGYFPRDLGYAAAGGISDDAPVIYDCGEDGLFVSLNSFSTATFCVKVDASPIAGLTVYPAYLYDYGDPPEGVAANPPLELQRRTVGQLFPNPGALKITQGGEEP